MNLLVLGCKTLREGVVVTAVFLAIGVLMILAATNIVPDAFYMRHIILVAGFLLVLFAPVILVSTFLLSVIPGAKEKLEKCER